MFIPRAIWTDKPVHLGLGLDELLGPNFRGTGQAYPNLGEYWYAFGAPAVVIFMCIYGWWMKRCVTLLGKSPEPVDHMAYAVLISVNLQLIIRGYTPSNFWLVIFSVVPLLILKPLCCFLSIKTGGNRYFNRL